VSAPRAQVRRVPDRGRYEQDYVNAILDAGFVCHVGFVEGEQPFVIPTIYGRDGDRLFLHGSPGSRLLRVARSGAPLCLTVTHVDGLVLARSLFHHSMNYRSVVVFGRGAEVADPDERLHALRILSDQVCPGRWDDARGPNAAELKQTMVVAVTIEDASGKVRTGPPLDDEEDYGLPHWAGLLPLRLVAGVPVPDPRLPNRVEAPGYLNNLHP